MILMHLVASSMRSQVLGGVDAILHELAQDWQGAQGRVGVSAWDFRETVRQLLRGVDHAPQADDISRCGSRLSIVKVVGHGGGYGIG
jgi:hypothetical protein